MVFYSRHWSPLVLSINNRCSNIIHYSNKLDVRCWSTLLYNIGNLAAKLDIWASLKLKMHDNIYLFLSQYEHRVCLMINIVMNINFKCVYAVVSGTQFHRLCASLIYIFNETGMYIIAPLFMVSGDVCIWLSPLSSPASDKDSTTLQSVFI